MELLAGATVQIYRPTFYNRRGVVVEVVEGAATGGVMVKLNEPDGAVIECHGCDLEVIP